MTNHFKIIGIVRGDLKQPKQWLYEDLTGGAPAEGFKTRNKAAQALWDAKVGAPRMQRAKDEEARLGRLRDEAPRVFGEGIRIPEDWAHRLYDVLVRYGLARDDIMWRPNFVHLLSTGVCTEYRVPTGPRVKFRNGGKAWSVDCDHAPGIETLEALNKANKELLNLWWWQHKVDGILHAIQRQMCFVDCEGNGAPTHVTMGPSEYQNFLSGFKSITGSPFEGNQIMGLVIEARTEPGLWVEVRR